MTNTILYTTNGVPEVAERLASVAQISLFTSVKANIPCEKIDFHDFVAKIRDGFYKELISKIRNEKDKDTRRQLKTSLPAVAIGGVFSKRSAKIEHLVDYSHLVVLDYDDLSDVEIDKASVSALDDYTKCAFISPSGNGLKIVVSTPEDGTNHKFSWQAASDYYERTYNLKSDPSGKDVCRLCLFSADPTIYYNPHALPIKKEWIDNVKEAAGHNDIKWKKFTSPPPPVSSSEKNTLLYRMKAALLMLEMNQCQLIKDYDDWMRIAFALNHGLGSDGLVLFREITQRYWAKEMIRVDQKYNECREPVNITYESFFALVRRAEEELGVQARYEYKRAEFVSFIETKYNIRLNTFSDKIEIFENEKYRPINDYDIINIMAFAEKMAGKKVEKAYIADTISLIAQSDRVDPVAEKIRMIPAENTGALGAVAAMLSRNTDVLNMKMADISFKKWFTGVIRQIIDPEYCNQICFVLQGDRQGQKKSTFFQKLGVWFDRFSGYQDAPANLESTDLLAYMSSKVLINIDELDKIVSKHDSSVLKDLITRRYIDYRKPYDRESVSRLRKCSFCGTTNASSFLKDFTGNRRFAIASVFENIEDDFSVEELVADAKYLIESGFESFFTQEEIDLVNEKAEEHRVVGYTESLILEIIDPLNSMPEWIGVAQVYAAISTISRGNESIRFFEIGMILKKLSIPSQRKRFNGGEKQTFYFLSIKEKYRANIV